MSGYCKQWPVRRALVFKDRPVGARGLVTELAVRVRRQAGSLPAAALGLALAGNVMAASLTLSVSDENGAALEHAAVALVPIQAQSAVPPQRAEIVQKDKRFTPLMSAIQTGSAVEFPNRDSVRHHVYSFSPAKTFELKLYLGKPAKPVVFDKPGIVVMGCNIHDHMVAYVLVANTPWLGVSDAQGRVRLSGLPAGDYRLEYWHPRWVGKAEIARLALSVDGDTAFTLKIESQP